MATKSIAWNTGTGNITLTYNGQGDGNIVITSDPNSLYEARSMQIKVRTTDGSNIERTVTIQQAAKARTDISTAVVTISGTYTYNGVAKTPVPTVTLNGTTIPSTGYDVAYSDNVNAGTATVTVTGKNEYTGSASGTFTINKASRTISFGNTYYVQNTSTTTTRTATPSAGSGDGAITYSISSTTYATINSSTGAVTSKTSDGSTTVTAFIAEGTNYLSASAEYTLYVFATTHDYSYNGSYRSVSLPPGTYKFDCWGAQGGSNGEYSTYGITAKEGGKGGYSTGQLTVSQATNIRVYVGGQGSSSAGGYNGGGSTSGTSQYNGSNELGYSKMGGGGGATDIRLSDGDLLSRMIVAGGGSGGAMCYRKKTISTTVYVDLPSITIANATYDSANNRTIFGSTGLNCGLTLGKTYKFSLSGGGSIAKLSDASLYVTYRTSGNQHLKTEQITLNTDYYLYYNYSGAYAALTVWFTGDVRENVTFTVGVKEKTTQSVVTEDHESQVGYAGGGTNGVGYNSNCYGKQNGAGNGASFGSGFGYASTNYRYVAGAGGGGWYGGGSYRSDDNMSTIHYSGGGSGWVNTSENAGNRPSGYTGLELDSGTTYSGNTSFPSTSGGTETGHSGNGYARITRL